MVYMPPQLNQSWRRAWAVVPTTSNGVAAMSPRRRASLLRGHDATTVLEAASTVLADIENGRFDAVVTRLPASDRTVLERWRREMSSEGSNTAPTPVHPLALLAATTLALGQSRSAQRSDEARNELARRLAAVGLRFNADVLEGRNDTRHGAMAYMSRSALWRAVEQEDWMIWSCDLVQEVSTMPEACALLEQFERAADLTLEEWWLRGVGERATRARHGARSWGRAEVDPRIDDAWARLSVAPLDEAVAAARSALVRVRRSKLPEVADPFNLHWLATRPVVETPDGRRFQLWLGANSRTLLPAGIAQTLADVTSKRYDKAAELLGRAAERVLAGYLDRTPPAPDENRLRESDMPASISKCDYVIERPDLLVGIDFTLLSPTRALSAGVTEGIEKFIDRVADKFAQVYSSFQWLDGGYSKRWLPLVVFASPTVVDPLLNERVHERLIQSGRGPDRDSEVMTCGAPEFLDLLEFSRQSGRAVSDLVLEWRDGPSCGAMLDWWLSDRGALHLSGKKRVGTIGERAEAVLAWEGDA